MSNVKQINDYKKSDNVLDNFENQVPQMHKYFVINTTSCKMAYRAILLLI